MFTIYFSSMTTPKLRYACTDAEQTQAWEAGEEYPDLLSKPEFSDQADVCLTSTTRTYTSSSGFSGAFTCKARHATGPGTYTIAHTITGTLVNVQL